MWHLSLSLSLSLTLSQTTLSFQLGKIHQVNHGNTTIEPRLPSITSRSTARGIPPFQPTKAPVSTSRRIQGVEAQVAIRSANIRQGVRGNHCRTLTSFNQKIQLPDLPDLLRPIIKSKLPHILLQHVGDQRDIEEVSIGKASNTGIESPILGHQKAWTPARISWGTTPGPGCLHIDIHHTTTGIRPAIQRHMRHILQCLQLR